MRMLVSRQLAYYLRQPYAPLFPILGLSVGVLLAWYVVHTTALDTAEHQKQELQRAWDGARQQFARHKDAMRAKRRSSAGMGCLSTCQRFCTPCTWGHRGGEARPYHVTLPLLQDGENPDTRCHESCAARYCHRSLWRRAPIFIQPGIRGRVALHRRSQSGAVGSFTRCHGDVQYSNCHLSSRGTDPCLNP